MLFAVLSVTAQENDGVILKTKKNTGALTPRLVITGNVSAAQVKIVESHLILEPVGTLVGNTAEIRFRELGMNGTNYVGLKAPDLLGSDVIWTLPDTPGSSGQVLARSGASGLTWVTPSGGGTISGSGTASFLSKFTGTQSLGNSLIFDDGTNVGIGTTSPNCPLTLGGNLAVTGTLGIKGDLSSRLVAMENTAANDRAVFKVDTSGLINLGIGVIDPVSRLEVAGGVSVGYVTIAAPMNSLIVSGNIGVGTSSPADRLHVANGNINVGGGRVTNMAAPSVSTDAATKGYVDSVSAPVSGSSAYIQNQNGSAQSATFRVSGTGEVGSLTAIGNSRLSNVFLGDVGHGPTYAGFSHNSIPGTGTYALLQSNDAAYTLLNKGSATGWIGFRINNADQMVIREDGKVGIGNTGPLEKLHVSGNVRIDGTLDLQNNRIAGVATPTNTTDAATKGYVDTQVSGNTGSRILAFAEVIASATLNSSLPAPGYMSLNGPTVVFNHSGGDVYIEFGCQAETAYASYQLTASCAPSFDAAAPSANDEAILRVGPNNGTWTTLTRVLKRNLAAGNRTIELQYKRFPGGTANEFGFSKRWLRVVKP